MAASIEELLIAIKLLGARQAALETQMVADSMGTLTERTVESDAANRESVGGFGLLGASMKGILGMAGLAGVAYGIKDIVGAGITWQRQQVALRNTLKDTGDYSQAAVNAVQNAADSMATRGGFTPEQNLQGMQAMVAETGSYKEAISGLTAETNLSRDSGLAFSRVQMMMQMALAGSTGRLQKYLGPLEAVRTHVDALSTAQRKNQATLDNAERLDKLATAQMIVAKIQEHYANATTKYSQTASGAMSNLRNAVQLVAIQLGTKLLPILTTIVKAVANFVLHHRTLVEIVLASIAAVGLFVAGMKAAEFAMKAWEGITKLGTALTWAWNLALKAFTIGQDAMALGWAMVTGSEEGATAASMGLALALDSLGIGQIIALIAALAFGVYMLIKHFSAVQKAVVQAFTAVWNFLKPYATKVYDILAKPYVDFIKFNVEVWETIVNFIAKLPGRIASVATHIWDGLKTGLLDVIKWILHQVTSIPGKIVHGLLSIGKSILSTVSFGLFHKGGIVKPQHFAGGGIVQAMGGWRVPGMGGGDSVPAMLTPGEGVLPVRAMRALGSQNFGILSQTGGGDVMVGGPLYNTIYMDSRKIAESVGTYQLKMAARK